MQAQAQFLKWVKDHHPKVFWAAVKKVRQKSALGGLGDDLVSDVSVDSENLTIDPSVTAAVDQAAQDQSTADSWAGFFSALSSAVSNVAPQVVQTQAQLAAINANAARAAAAKTPVTATSLLTGSGVSAGGTAIALAIAALIGLGILMKSRR